MILSDLYQILLFLEKLGFNLIKKEIGNNYESNLTDKNKKKINKYLEKIEKKKIY